MKFQKREKIANKNKIKIMKQQTNCNKVNSQTVYSCLGWMWGGGVGA
jgi:hypothetical protein